MAVKFKAELDSKNFENNLKIFASSLGGILKELMETVGKEMVAESKGRAFCFLMWVETSAGLCW
jgi:hypothetical protein